MEPKPAIRLRGGTGDDLDAMFQLDVACFDEVFRFSRAAMRRFTQGPNRHSFVAETDAGELAGFVILTVHPNAGVGYIVTLDVAAAYRRGGVARLLMAAAEAKAAGEQMGVVELHVFSGNTAARALYADLGYEDLDTAEDFYGRGLDAQELRKVL